ncbi:MAG: hypothetical protein AAB886_01245 [Patescibacteria group bacterium]
MRTHIVVIAFTVVVFTGAGCSLVPGSRVEQQGTLEKRLPDHITVVYGTTLPAALKQARGDGRSSVKVSDKSSNVIEVTVNDPTHTLFKATKSPVDAPFSVLKVAGLDVIDRAYDKTVDENTGDWSFKINVANEADVAAIIYEISVRVFNIPSTTEWTIDIK